jgi:hypothetical protein
VLSSEYDKGVSHWLLVLSSSLKMSLVSCGFHHETFPIMQGNIILSALHEHLLGVKVAISTESDPLCIVWTTLSVSQVFVIGGSAHMFLSSSQFSGTLKFGWGHEKHRRA